MVETVGPAFPQQIQSNNNENQTTEADAERERLFQLLISKPDHEQYEEKLENLLSLYTHPDEQISVLNEILEKCESSQIRNFIFRWFAGIMEQLGRLHEAQDYYESAAFLSTDKKDFSSLMESAKLLFELGNLEKSENQAKTVITAAPHQTLIIDALILLAKISNVTGDIPTAGRQAENIISKYPVTQLRPAQLYSLAIILEESGLTNRFEQISGLLREQFPDSIEAHLINKSDQTKITEYPQPNLFFQFQSEPLFTEETISPAIQTGSFVKKEHAETMVSQLQKDGFQAEILVRKHEDTRYYKVILPPDPAKEVQKTLIELKEKGYEAFLLFNY